MEIIATPERCIKYMTEFADFHGYPAGEKVRSHVLNLLQAEKDGLIPPCKRGDVVYCIRRNPRTGYYVKALTVCTVTVWGPGRFSVFTTKEDVLGKTAFLTRAEAEAALTDGTGETLTQSKKINSQSSLTCGEEVDPRLKNTELLEGGGA